jgi:hypothetical protein
MSNLAEKAVPLELPEGQWPFIESAFNRVRWQMGGIPARLECRDVKEVAYWDRMLIVISIRYILEGKLAFVEEVSYHELGHANRLWDVPGTFQNMVIDNLMVGKLTEGKWPKGLAHQFLNIVYDTIDDTLGAWEFQRNPLVTLATCHAVEPEDLSGYTPGKNPVSEWLTAFREALMSQPISKHISDPVREAAGQSLEIIRKTWDNRARVKQIAELLYPLFAKQFDEGLEAMKALLAALGVGNPGVANGSDPDAMLEGLDLDDAEIRDTVSEIIGQGLGGQKLNMDFEQIWQKAGRKVRFQLECKEKSPGERLRAGDLPWTPGMPLRDLDIVRTLEQHGRFMPGQTTLRPLMVQGPGSYVEAPVPRRMVINCDVSGSMNQCQTVTALFTFIREAQRRRKPVAVDIFGDSHYYVPFSANYRQVAQRIYENYHVPGGGNSVAGPEQLVDKLQAGDLLTYVTDFGLVDSDQKQAVEVLQTLKGKGVAVVFICMFTESYAARCGLPYVLCENIEQLADLTLKTL